MPRIRSLHPGQPKDSDFVEMSFEARYLCLFIRNWADDQGVFEWKPKQMKMEIFPADTVDVEPLLEEMLKHRQVMRYEHQGRVYGAVRNFGDWQRPKKPKRVHPVTAQVRDWVTGKGKRVPDPDDDDGGDVPHQYPTGSENSPQRKEEGGNGRRKEGGGEPRASARDPQPKNTRLDKALEPLRQKLGEGEHGKR
jgi:hypothetical protein